MPKNSPANDDIGLGSVHSPAQIYVPETGSAGARKTWEPILVITNLPDSLPILPAEIALLETYWGAILDLMAVNDNEPS